MQLAFRLLVILNGLMLAAAFFYRSPGEDPAGAGMRLGFAVVYAALLAGALLLYHFVRLPWVRIAVLIFLTLPALSVLYGVLLSL